MVNDQRLREYPPVRFREAALAVVKENGRVESWRAPDLIATALGLDYRAFASSRVYQVNPLDARARSALNVLAASGEIVKVPRSQQQPDGNYDSQHAFYYSYERFAADKADYERRTVESADGQQRVARVHDRLGKLGIETGGTLGVSLETWEREILPVLEAEGLAASDFRERPRT